MPEVVRDADSIVSALFGGAPRKTFLQAVRTCDVYVSSEMRREVNGFTDELVTKSADVGSDIFVLSA